MDRKAVRLTGLSWLHERGITAQAIREYGLLYDPEQRAIRIPYYDGRGRERGHRLRFLDGRTMKYQSPKGSRAHLYNVKDVDSPTVYITEGEWDCLILKQLGLSAVGVPGVTSFKREWKWLFAGADEVVVVFDGDDAGREGARRVAGYLSSVVENVDVVDLPDGADINSLALEGELAQWLPALSST